MSRVRLARSPIEPRFAAPPSKGSPERIPAEVSACLTVRDSLRPTGGSKDWVNAGEDMSDGVRAPTEDDPEDELEVRDRDRSRSYGAKFMLPCAVRGSVLTTGCVCVPRTRRLLLGKRKRKGGRT